MIDNIREFFKTADADHVLNILKDLKVCVKHGGRRYSLNGANGDLSLKEVTELVFEKTKNNDGKRMLAAGGIKHLDTKGNKVLNESFWSKLLHFFIGEKTNFHTNNIYNKFIEDNKVLSGNEVLIEELEKICGFALDTTNHIK